MKPFYQPKVIASGLFAGLLGSLSPSAARAGGTIFETNQLGNTIGEYTTAGATVNAALISGLPAPVGIAVSGSDLFVANLAGGGTIGEYTTSGATVNPALISGLDLPFGIALSGADLFVANLGGGTIGEYTTAGATVNPALISGLSAPAGIAISGSSVPEASTWVMMLLGFAALAFAGFRRARPRAASA
jgi:hypothetical protein